MEQLPQNKKKEFPLGLIKERAYQCLVDESLTIFGFQ